MPLLSHRGPDASAVWLSHDRRLALGHARLKIIDLSDSANQPMLSPDSNLALIYNGEIVNYRDVKAKYRGPWQFRTQGDTEVLLATFAQRGIEAMHDWVGMFAFALYDRDSQKLHLVRDRFGIKPIYWTRLADGGFAAASEIPPLLKLQQRAMADESTIRTYLETGLYDTSAQTFFACINSIGAGCAAEIDLRAGNYEEKRWYCLGDALPDLSNVSERDLIERGAALVETAISDHLTADVRVGLNVSGGVDSSVLVRATLPHVKNLHVFTQDFEEPYSEGPWVRQVANGANLHLCTLNREDIEARLDWTVRRQAEPFGGVSVVGYDAIYSSAVEKGVTVLLDGNGIDECFLGYSRYLNGANKLEKGQAIDGSRSVAPDAMTSSLQKQSPVALRDHGTVFADPIKAAAAQDLLVTKIPRGLRFNDRMSMGHSRELRVPFLDHRLAEFGFAVPTRYLLQDGRTKSLFRKIARQWIPESIAEAPKRSVQSPQREWLAGAWRPLVDEVLASQSFAGRGWIEPTRARAIYEEYVAGSQENSFFVWQWLNLEYWARAYLD